MKFGPFIVVLMMLVYWYANYIKGPIRIVFFGIYVLTICFSISIYKNIPFTNANFHSFCELGKFISTDAMEDQVIFVKDLRRGVHDYPINPIIILCAERNIAIYQNEDIAKELITKNNVNSGIIYTLIYFDNMRVDLVDIETIEI